MKNFLNDRSLLVQESLDGLVAGSGGRLQRLDGYPHIKVVIRSDHREDRVAVISGGGSGHEPAHAGFVGPGMLTAAVCGEIFASPTVEAVLAAIRAVTGPAGALLIVKNYTGDRLNFGLAAERARQGGYKVEVVMVGDDVSLAPSVQPRGLAGTLFVHKVAGYFAEAGHDLGSVTMMANEVAAGTRSLGLALTTCEPPESAKKETIPDDQAEMGLGIHGEPGAERVDLVSARQLMSQVVERLQAGQDGEAPLCLLLNNLGAVPPLEMGVLLGELLASPLGQRAELLLGPAHLMTSYDMNGFSVSMLPLSDPIREALTAPAPVPAWPGAVKLVPSLTVALPETNPKFAPPSSDPVLKARLLAVLGALSDARDHLNALDARVGDGDAGDTFATAAASIGAVMSTFPLAEPSEFLSALSETLGRAAGGSSGILLAIFTGAASVEYRHTKNWPRAMEYGAERMTFYGGAKVGDRTMLDAMWPAIEAFKEGRSLAEVAAAAREGANRTADLTSAGAGRSAYLGAGSLQGVVDPGAEAIAVALEAIAALPRDER